MNDWTNLSRPVPRLGRDIRVRIGRQLRAMYDDLVRQGVPPRFVDLLDRLDERTEAEPAERKARG